MFAGSFRTASVPSKSPAMSRVQLFAGAPDLLTAPASKPGTPAGRIWCEAGTKIHIDKPGDDPVRFTVADSSGEKIIDHAWEADTKRRGWHEIVAYAPEATPYEAYFTYKATGDLHRSDCEA